MSYKRDCQTIAEGAQITIRCKNGDGAFDVAKIVDNATVNLSCTMDDNRLDSLQDMINALNQTLTNLQQQVTTNTTNISGHDTHYTDTQGNPLSANACLVTCEPFNQLSNQVQTLSNNSIAFSLKSCGGQPINDGASVPSCAEFTGLSSQVAGLSNTVTNLNSTIQGYDSRLSTLERDLRNLTLKANGLDSQLTEFMATVNAQLGEIRGQINNGSDGNLTLFRWKKKPFVRYEKGVEWGEYEIDGTDPGESDNQVIRDRDLVTLQASVNGQWIDVPKTD